MPDSRGAVAQRFGDMRDRQIAKFWLQPVSLAKNKGFRKHELDRITRLVLQYEEMFVEAWHDYFNP